MAKEKETKTKRRNRSDVDDGGIVFSGLKDETKLTIYAIIAFLFAAFFVIAAFGGGGIAGHNVFLFLRTLVGVGYVFLPVISILVGVSMIGEYRPKVTIHHLISAIIFLISALCIIDIASIAHAGGLLGRWVAYPILRLFDINLSILFFGAANIISLLMLFDTKPAMVPFVKRMIFFLRHPFSKEKPALTAEMNLNEAGKIAEAAAASEKISDTQPKEVKKVKDEDEEFNLKPSKRRMTDFTPPPLTLLESDSGKPNVGDIKGNANIIKRTLANFGIQVEMDEVTIGPSVTRYALKPAEGVKLSRIVGLQNDLSLQLAVHPIRIEAPIPGKSLVGIEIPNKSKSKVGLRTLLEDAQFSNTDMPLLMGIGRGLSGKAKFINLAKMPHMLIAGTTGSGKSVAIHTLVTSLLYRLSPEDLRFIMIDPKRVELTLYNKIPHLLTPVITDAKKAILSLKWAAKEMERRYNILEQEAVRDIDSYHKTIANRKGRASKDTARHDSAESDGEEAPDRMPFIVIILDELADIMSSYPRELEAGIVRLAQMSRAVGIHLILSTQRPEVNVITGLIKANVPARLALKVSSQIDSRTILDTGGAEKLLGAGDMLFLAGDTPQPERYQSAFISEDEVKRVVLWLRKQYENELIEDIALTGTPTVDNAIFSSSIEDAEIGEDDDEMYEAARLAVVEAGKASTSYLQRKLKLGYARAARLMDVLEERGVIGPADGAKPREILIKSVEEESKEYGA